MFAAYAVVNKESVHIENYDSLQAALDDLVEFGWEESPDILVACPVLVWAMEGSLPIRIAAIITYSMVKGEVQPLLHVQVVGQQELLSYRCNEYGNTSYKAVRLPHGWASVET